MKLVAEEEKVLNEMSKSMALQTPQKSSYDKEIGRLYTQFPRNKNKETKLIDSLSQCTKE